MAMNPLQRRDLLRAALSLALLPWRQAGAQQAAAPRWQSEPFSLGVASGLPRPDSVLLWTRLLPAPEEAAALARLPSVALDYELFADSALKQPVRSGRIDALATRAHSVHLPLRGLQAGRDYWYRFHCAGAVSPVGHTRTAPLEGARALRLRLALASCQHWEHGHYAAHRDIARQDLDFVLFVGDYIYEGTGRMDAVRSHGGPAPRTLDEYRARHALYKSDPALQAAHAAHPWVMTWDDHEVVNDYANDRDQAYSDPAVFLKRRAAAYQAYFEHMPILPVGDASQGQASTRIHDRMVWGDLAELWTLDNRQHRSHHACPDPYRGGGRLVLDCAELEDPQRSMLGLAQERWLTQGLNASTRGWKLLAQGTQMAPSGLDALSGLRATYTDGWDGYPQARKRLMGAIQQAGLRDVMALGGDVHYNQAGNLRLNPNDAKSAPLASEFVTTSISSRGMANSRLQTLQESNPDMVYARSDERGYALLEITPHQARCQFRSTVNAQREDAALRVQAVYAVERGRAGVQRG